MDKADACVVSQGEEFVYPFYSFYYSVSISQDSHLYSSASRGERVPFRPLVLRYP
jgi:hypothetical protein